MPEDNTPITMFFATCPYRKDGTPVVGNMGSQLKRVIIMDADSWSRLVAQHPTLATAQFRVGELG